MENESSVARWASKKVGRITRISRRPRPSRWGIGASGNKCCHERCPSTRRSLDRPTGKLQNIRINNMLLPKVGRWFTESFIGRIEHPIGWGAEESVLEEDDRSVAGCLSLARLVAEPVLGRPSLVLLPAVRNAVKFQNVTVQRCHQVDLRWVAPVCHDFRLIAIFIN